MGVISLAGRLLGAVGRDVVGFDGTGDGKGLSELVAGDGL